MKTKKILFGMAFSFLAFTSCTNETTPDKDSTAVTATDIALTQNMDDSIDDISFIADDQYEAKEGSPTGKTETYTSILPDCVTISDIGSTSTLRVLTITFGSSTTTCKFRGHDLKGKIILNWSIGTSFPKTMTISYDGFSINGNTLNGTSTWKREMIGTAGVDLHPKTTFNVAKTTLTTSLGVFKRNGERIREMTKGFSTRINFLDDEFSTYGAFTTTYPNGTIFTSLVEASTPLVHKTACFLSGSPFPVSGMLKLTKNAHYATLNYGTGDCDALASLSIDGGVATQITLEKK